MLARRDEIVKVLMEFQRNPSARTFKDAENIPDILMGQAVDAIVGQVLGGVSEKVTIPDPAKKTPQPGMASRHSPTEARDGRSCQGHLLPASPETTQGTKMRARKTRMRRGGNLSLVSAARNRRGRIARLWRGASVGIAPRLLPGGHCGTAAAGHRRVGKRVRSVALAIGRLSLEARERRLAALQVKVDSGSPVDGGRPSCRGKRLAVAMDGGRVLIRTNNKGRRTAKGFHTYRTDWREPKLFIIYELDDAGRKKRRSMVKCDGTIGNPDALVRLLVAELRSIGADEAETVVFLGDGANGYGTASPILPGRREYQTCAGVSV